MTKSLRRNTTAIATLLVLIVVSATIPQAVAAEGVITDQNPDEGWTVWVLQSVTIHDMGWERSVPVDPDKGWVDVEAVANDKAFTRAVFVAEGIRPDLAAVDLTQPHNLCRFEWGSPFTLRWFIGDPDDWGEIYIRIQGIGWDSWDPAWGPQHRGYQETWEFTRLSFEAGSNPPQTATMESQVGWGDGRTWLPLLRGAPNPHFTKTLIVDTYHDTRCDNFPSPFWAIWRRRCPSDHFRLFFRMPKSFRIRSLP